MLKAGDSMRTLSGCRYGTKSGDDIVTVFVHPPIPVRDHDWCAYHDSEMEQGNTYGWGSTEQEALVDLRRLDHERSEYEHGEEE